MIGKLAANGSKVDVGRMLDIVEKLLEMFVSGFIRLDEDEYELTFGEIAFVFDRHI
jgi:hypothetical protein